MGGGPMRRDRPGREGGILSGAARRTFLMDDGRPAEVEEVMAEVGVPGSRTNQGGRASSRSFREPSYFVLASLLDGPQHGYGIIKAADRLSHGEVRLAPGTLYGALDRLSASGLIESDGEEVVAGRARHYYRLTPTGRDLLVAEANRMALAANAVLGRSEPVESYLEPVDAVAG